MRFFIFSLFSSLFTDILKALLQEGQRSFPS